MVDFATVEIQIPYPPHAGVRIKGVQTTGRVSEMRHFVGGVVGNGEKKEMEASGDHSPI